MMEDTLLIDAAERFARGEMSAEEKIYFEDLRKNNPELDQAVVEQIFFLNQLEAYGSNKNFKTVLKDTEYKLAGEKFITRSTPAATGKLVMLWSKYRRTIAVAASIAGVVSLFIATLVSTVTKTANPDVRLLMGKMEDQDKKTQHLQTQINILANQTTSVIPSRVVVESKYRATGFIIDAQNNYLVTNAHVVQQFKNNLVVENADEQYTAKVIYVNNATDLAIVKITDPSFKSLGTLPYGIRRSEAELAEQIFMLGYPKQETVYGEGYVSAKNGYRMDTVYCQISTSANAGNSGSPVLSKSGDIIGIITSTETNASGVVFAIKSANIYRAIEEVKKMKDNGNIKFNSVPALRKLDRKDQVAKIQPYVFMIKGN